MTIANLGSKDKNTFTDDQHPTLKADFIMANPPYNQKKWRKSDELVDDYRWEGYETPPESNANYAWILHMVSKLSLNGIAGFILSNGVLSSGSTEYKIRKQLIKNDLVEAIIVCPMNMFYTTDTSVSLWIINKNKKYQEVFHNDEVVRYRDRKGEVLFIDARNFGSVYDKKYIKFEPEDDINKINSIFQSWRRYGSKAVYSDIVELCYSASYEEIKKKDYTLVPSKYIQFRDDEKFEHLDDNLDELKEHILKKLLIDMEVNKSLLSILQEES